MTHTTEPRTPRDEPTRPPHDSSHEISDGTGPRAERRDGPGRRRVHRAWFVAAVTFVTIIGAAAFRSLPGLLIDPLHQDFAW